MLRLRSFFLFVAFFLFTQLLLSQQLTGVVLATTELPNAQVLLRTEEAIVGFAMTDSKGQFTLDLKRAEASSRIEVRFFGYADWSRELSRIDTSQLLRVVLREENIELNEVVVSAASLPQINKGDTLIYNTDAYRDGSERKIEEVIAKLPGAEVDEAGNIKIKGKALGRILVDGEDLFDKNYKLLSKNVPADFVNRIDVMDNYHQDALVGDLSENKETVLNLHLDPDKKRPLFGEINAQGGNAGTRAANGSLFRLGSKMKTVNFSDYGTLGEASSVGVNLLYRSQGLGSRIPTGIRPVLRSEASRQHRLVRPVDYLDNEAYGTAQTLLFPIGEKAKNRLIFNISGENYQLSDERLRENIALTRVDSFRQENDYGYRSRRFWLVNDFDVLLSPKSRFDVRLSVTGADNRALVSTANELVGADTLDNLGTTLEERPISYLASLRYVRRINDNMALRLNGSLKKEDIDQWQQYQGSVYQILPGLPAAPTLTQVFNQNLTEANAEVNVLQELKAYQFNYTLGHRNSQVISGVGLAEASQQDTPLNTFNYQLQETYLTTSAHRNYGKLNATAGLTISYFGLDADQAGREAAKKTYRWAAQPSFNLEYDFNRRNNLRFWAKSTRKNQRADQLVAVPFLASGSTLSTGLDTTYLVETHATGLRYAYSNTFSQYGYGFDLTYRHTPNGIRSSVVTENFVVLDQLIPGFASGMASASVRGDKYFSRLKTNVKINLRYDYLTDQLSFGSELFPTVTEIQTLALRTSTKFSPKLSYGLRADYSEFTNQIAGNRSSQRQLLGRQQVVYRPGKQTKVNLNHHLYLPRLGTGAQAINLIGTEINQEWPQHQLLVGLGIRNLLNTRTIGERSISVFQRHSRIYRLRPRTFYCTLTKTF